MLRNVAAGAAGLLAAIALVALIENVGHTVYPPPQNLDFSDPDAMLPYIATLPIAALLFVMFAWFIGPFAGTLIACYIGNAPPRVYAVVVGSVILAATIANLILIPHPLWFSITAIIGIMLSAWAAMRLAPQRTAAANSTEP